MFKMTALSDFAGFLTLTHFLALASIALTLAGVIEFAAKDEGHILTFALTASIFAVNLFALCFVIFVGSNTIMVQRYGSSDLFISTLLVIGGFIASALLHKSFTEADFDPIFFVLGAVVAVIFSGMFAILLPLVGKASAWIP